MDSNKNVTATFTEVSVPQYTLTLNKVGSGSVELSPAGGVYDSSTVVNLTATPASGWKFSGWSGDLSGVENPTTITMASDKNVIAMFAELPPLQYTLTANTSGSGNVDLSPPGGIYDAQTLVTLTANPASGWEFGGWSGDLTGVVNPTTLAMDSDKNVTATFTEQSSGGGTVTFEEIQSGGSSGTIAVATSGNLIGVGGDLYLAAISSKPYKEVVDVSGLGLNWTLVRNQCAGRHQTGVEIWMALGVPSGNGSVTATFSGEIKNAVISVSRYSGADASSPVGNVISGNTFGIDGLCSGGSDTDSYSFDLTTTVNGSVVYSAVAMRNKNHTPGVGYTERSEFMQGSGGSAASVAVEEQTVDSPTTVLLNGLFNDKVDWAVVGIEIMPQGSFAKSYLNPGIANSELNSQLPSQYQLFQNFPNPFNPSTLIRYNLPKAGHVKLMVYDVSGRTVIVLVDGYQKAGYFSHTWDARNSQGQRVASGIYFYRIQAGSFSKSYKMLLVH